MTKKEATGEHPSAGAAPTTASTRCSAARRRRGGWPPGQSLPVKFTVGEVNVSLRIALSSQRIGARRACLRLAESVVKFYQWGFSGLAAEEAHEAIKVAEELGRRAAGVSLEPNLFAHTGVSLELDLFAQ